MTLLPSSTMGGLSYALMNNCESALVAIFTRPEYVAVLTFTRKAIDLAKALIDMVGASVEGSFSHLVASNQRHRALQVHSEITSLPLSLSIVMASTYMGANSSFVSIWVGSSQFGGVILTILLALRFLAVSNSYLMNNLYRATGAVMQGYLTIFLESIIRVPLMIGLLLWWGLPGIPVAGIFTAGLSGWLAYRWTIQDLREFSDPIAPVPLRLWVIRLLMFCSGMLICLFFRTQD